MFVIPIVSCTSTLVAPSNLSIIALLSNMEVYNSSLKFKKIENVNHEKKSWFPIDLGNLVLHNTKFSYGKTIYASF